MKRIFFILVLGVVFILGLASCGPKEYTTYELASFCDQVDGKQQDVTVSGVLKIGSNISEENKVYGVLLAEALDQNQPVVRIGIPIGTGNNQTQPISNNFTLEDVKVQTNDGKTVTHGDPITISGHFSGACSAGLTSIKVDIITSP